MKDAQMYIYSDVNTVKAVDGWGAYLLVTEGKNGPITYSRLCEMQGATKTTAEIMLIAEALDKVKQPFKITIHVNGTQTITALREWMPAWKDKGWRNSKGEEVSEWYRVIDRLSFDHILDYTAESGEYSTWLKDNARRNKAKGEKGCLISLENLAAPKRSTKALQA